MRGVSSPVVWEDKIFLTGADENRRELYCFEAQTGNLFWQKPVTADTGEREPPKVTEETGFAAPTPVTDGRRVYAMFANGDLAAFDFAGNQVWSRNLGVPDNPYGHASSLAMHKNLLIIQYDQALAKDGKSKLMALHGDTGEVAWQVDRPIPASWASPIVVEFEGQPRIITAGEPWVIAYSPTDGKELWRAECLQGDVGPSPAYSEGMVFVANDNAAVVAIRDGGEGDVTETHVQWTMDLGMPDTCSPLVTDRFLLLIATYGALVCYDRNQGGEPLWEEDFGAIFVTSPSLVGDRVYMIGDDGKGWVVQPGPEGCARFTENELGERCLSSPAFQPGRIYIRGEVHLFCIGAK